MNNSILDEDFQHQPLVYDRATVLKINSLKTRVNFGLKELRKAKILLVVLVILSIISIGYTAIMRPINTTEAVVEGVFLAIIYLVAALRLGKSPTRWLYSVVIIFSVYWLLTILVDVSYIYRGILLKGVVYYYLIKGLEGAKDVESGLGELRAIGVSALELAAVEDLEDLEKAIAPKE